MLGKYSPFNSCLVAFCSLMKEMTPKIRMFWLLFPNKERYFESFVCLGLVSES